MTSLNKNKFKILIIKIFFNKINKFKYNKKLSKLIKINKLANLIKIMNLKNNFFKII